MYAIQSFTDAPGCCDDQFCLPSDDPTVFGSTGLSFDFYQVLVSGEVSEFITMGTVVLDSLKLELVFVAQEAP